MSYRNFGQYRSFASYRRGGVSIEPDGFDNRLQQDERIGQPFIEISEDGVTIIRATGLNQRTILTLSEYAYFYPRTETKVLSYFGPDQIIEPQSVGPTIEISTGNEVKPLLHVIKPDGNSDMYRKGVAPCLIPS